MTKQALNSMNLYRGQDPKTILLALNMQKRQVVQELKEYFKTDDLRELSYKLSNC